MLLFASDSANMRDDRRMSDWRKAYVIRTVARDPGLGEGNTEFWRCIHNIFHRNLIIEMEISMKNIMYVPPKLAVVKRFTQLDSWTLMQKKSGSISKIWGALAQNRPPPRGYGPVLWLFWKYRPAGLAVGTIDVSKLHSVTDICAIGAACYFSYSEKVAIFTRTGAQTSCLGHSVVVGGGDWRT